MEYVIQVNLNKINGKLFLGTIDKVQIMQKESNNNTIFAGLELGIINLYNYLIQIQINEGEFESIYYSILEGIITMHDNHYAHRDIKPQNILYVERKGWVLSDFGCSIKYQNIEDDYEITGTKAFLPNKIRQLVPYPFRKIITKLDLFSLDIYAFQLTMLLLLRPQVKFDELQKIIDDCLPSHRLIDALYNKNLEQVKLIQKQSYERVNIQNTVSSIVKAMQSNTMDDENQKIKLKLRSLQFMFQYLSKTPESYNIYEKELNNIYNQCSDENKLYIELLLAQWDFTKPRCEINEKLFHSVGIFKVNENMKSWQYNLLQDYLHTYGDIIQCYENCIKYQEVKKKKNIKYKLEEIEYAKILGFNEAVKLCINTIEHSAYYFDDLNYLRYYYHKTLINNQWWEIQDEVFSYFKHIKQVLPGITDQKIYIQDATENLEQKVSNVKDRELMFLMKIKENIGVDASEMFENSYIEKYILNANEKQESKIESMIENNILNKGYGNVEILSNCANLQYLLGNVQMAFDIFTILVNQTKTGFPYPEFKLRLHIRYTALLVEIGHFQDALRYATIACNLLKFNDKNIFDSIIIHWLLWYIKVRLNDSDFQNTFQILMNLFKEFKAKKLKLGQIKRLQNGFLVLLKRHQYTEYQYHLFLLENCIGEDQGSLTYEYSYLLHSLRWDLFLTQRNIVELINEFNYFMINLMKQNDDRSGGYVIRMMGKLVSVCYFDEKLSKFEKNQLFSQYLQSFLIQADLSYLDESDKFLSRKNALKLFHLATKDDNLMYEMSYKIMNQVVDHYY